MSFVYNVGNAKFTMKGFTPNYEIVKINLIKKLEDNNLIIINKIIEDTQTYWNNIRKNLRWLCILSKEYDVNNPYGIIRMTRRVILSYYNI